MVLTSKTAGTTRVYRPEIDGLRCVAVLSVIFYHAGFGVFSGGYVGVDIFFVISGFLITGIVYDELLSGTFSLVGFYERRARRILPAAFLMLLTCIPLGWYLLPPAQLKDLSNSIMAVVTFVSNHYFFKKTGYFSASADEIPLLHMWTLSVEEQFYLVLPLTLILLCRARLWFMRAALWCGLIFSLALCLRWEYHNPLMNFFLAPPRAWEFLAGSLLALMVPENGSSGSRAHLAANAASLAGSVLILFSVIYFDSTTSFPGWWTLLPVVGTGLIIRFGYPETLIGRLLSLPPLVGIGLVSYSAYLWHQPIIAFSYAATGLHSDWVMKVGALLLIAVLSYLSWRFVEKPFRDRSRISRFIVFSLSAIGTIALGTLGLTGLLGKGFPGRYSDLQNTIANNVTSSPMREKCHTEGEKYLRPENACRYFGGQSHWAVFGDSHAVELSFALAEYLQANHQGSVLHLSNSGCQPALLFKSDVPGCSAWILESLELLERDASITKVVVSFRHSFHLFGSQLRSFPQPPSDPPKFLANMPPDKARDLYWSSFVAILNRLIASGKTLYVLTPIPELGRSIEWHIYGSELGARTADWTAGSSRTYYEKRNDFVLSRMKLLDLGPQLILVPSADAFCETQICRAGSGQTAYYFDDQHPSVAGARKLVSLLFAHREE